MSESPAEDFQKRVAGNGVKIRDLPNTRTDGDEWRFADYVAKDASSWAFVPEDPEEVDVEEVAESEMYAHYEELGRKVSEVTVERLEDDMYWANVSVSVPEDAARRERVAEAVATAVQNRWN